MQPGKRIQGLTKVVLKQFSTEIQPQTGADHTQDKSGHEVNFCPQPPSQPADDEGAEPGQEPFHFFVSPSASFVPVIQQTD